MKDKRLKSKARLIHIQQAIKSIQRFTKDLDKASFEKQELVHQAVLMQFIVIGEAINHVDDEILNRYAYPWYKVKSFRNFIAHEYFNLKLSAVWEIISQELEALSQIIDKMINIEFT
ncbi:HepT-like ribonuclease domain-containing protein [Cecembia lonarensis]|uniref:DUF86 domain-containing protein n=1 Tax=Cecembia lonarensis (strain CCUG 58316 / KCTC 22772 / LW9) TaxID=1225176 RepID=K1L0C6_CECL9|nr:HepT-like ribonuclease domain-containing protein [Cecembia lonarensis]EKB49795.1 hypothetical protein B879_01578 [Cecembia lonarensis LW9]